MNRTPLASEERPPVAWVPLLLLVAVKLALHVSVLTRYGWFRDELYYAASTHHLALGYVDHPPLSIAVLAAWTAIFGPSLPAVRALAALIGASTVLLAGLTARELGGRAFAQTLAAIAVLCAPQLLGSQFFFSMNGIDQALSAAAFLFYVRLLRRGDNRSAIALGAILGFALLNKLSALWLVAGMFAGLLLTRHRVLLARRGVWIGAAVAALLFVPHVIWQIAHGFPTREFARNAAELKMVRTTPAEFWSHQLLDMNPASAPVWIVGVVAPLAAAAWRRWAPLSIVFLTVAAILMLGPSKTYYLAIAYFGVFAAGAAVLERWNRWVRLALAFALLSVGAIAAPLALPMLPAARVPAYMRALGMSPRFEERHEAAALPQHFADMHGWPEMAAAVRRAVDRLTPEERAHAVVYGQNYGEAAAVDVLGRRLGAPRAISGHNSYWMWGPGADSVSVVIVIGGDLEDNRAVFESFEVVDTTYSRWAMPYENGLTVGIGRGLKQPLRDLWPQLRVFI